VIWLNPAAWIGLVALAGPVLIHILVQRRAERLLFPSLRFLQQTRLASIRRHVLEDVPLLAIRAAIVALAVAALAGPLVVTSRQRRAWNARVVRAIVVDGVARAFPASARDDALRALQPSAFLSQTFETPSLSDGIPRAVAWLGAAPPARRELVIVGPLALGSVTPEDVAAVPVGIAIRFERLGTLPHERSVQGGEVLSASDPRVPAGAHRQTVTLSRDRTSVTELPASDLRPLPLEVVSSSAARPLLDLATAAVISQRVWAPAANRHGRLVLVEASIDPSAIADAAPIVEPWSADAVASMVKDHDLQTAGSQVPAGINDTRFSLAPWRPLFSASDGRPLAAAAASKNGIVVVSGAEPGNLVTPLLLRAMVNALGGPPDLHATEVLPIPDAQLQAWSRPASPVVAPPVDQVERDDRWGLWLLVLTLLALETWVRRARTAPAAAPYKEDARVA
jgi:hypothetical protein